MRILVLPEHLMQVRCGGIKKPADHLIMPHSTNIDVFGSG